MINTRRFRTLATTLAVGFSGTVMSCSAANSASTSSDSSDALHECNPGCKPTTCAALGGATCGTIGDGCGGKLDCGPCGDAGSATTNDSGDPDTSNFDTGSSGGSEGGPASYDLCDQTAGAVAPLYSTTSFWNVPIPSNPTIDPDSAAMVDAALVAYAGTADLANDSSWGIPIVYGHSTDKSYAVGCTLYGCNTSVSFPIPAGVQPNAGSDHHLTVIDLDTWSELDMWGASYSSSTDTWTAESRVVGSASGWGALCAQGQHCLGAVAAGFSMAGGVLRPEELAQGHIDHALTMMTPLTRSGYIACPATNTDGRSASTSALPEGARVQLDPAFDVAAQAWPSWLKAVAVALQRYGAYVSDTGGAVAFYAESTLNCSGDRWGAAGVPSDASLAGLPWSQFRVLGLESCN